MFTMSETAKKLEVLPQLFDTTPFSLRADGLREWLVENGQECFAEQAHLNEGSRERVYWHYGYLVALRDVLNLLARQQQEKTH